MTNLDKALADFSNHCNEFGCRHCEYATEDHDCAITKFFAHLSEDAPKYWDNKTVGDFK